MEKQHSRPSRQLAYNKREPRSAAMRFHAWVLAPVCFVGMAASAVADPQQLDVTSQGDHAYKAEWSGVAGRTYFMRSSSDLNTWTYKDVMEFGAGPHAKLVQDTSDKFFLGLRYEDIAGVSSLEGAMAADIDSDGLSNLFELAHGLDPFDADSDDDGTSDGAEDTDGDGVINSSELAPYFEWDAANDTEGDNKWDSTTSNSYSWTFDQGSLSPLNVASSRFATLTKAYAFPSAVDQSSNNWNSYGSDQPASFEFVLDVDGSDGIIFETGANGDGIQIDVSQGVLRAAIAESANVVVSHNLTNAQKSDFIHVVVVADSVNDVLQLYVDGQLKDSEPWTAGNDWSGSNDAGLGGTNSNTPLGDTGDFSGKIAQFRFYKSALSNQEIGVNYRLLGPPSDNAPAWKTVPVVESNASDGIQYSASLADDVIDLEADALSFAKVAGPSWLNVAYDGTLSGRATQANVGLNTFTVSVTDGYSAPVEATLEITVDDVNNVPVANEITIVNPNSTAVAVVLTGSDWDNDTLTYSVTGQPSNGTLTGTAPNLTYTPDSGFEGIDRFYFKVSDGSLESQAATCHIYSGNPIAHFKWDADLDVSGDNVWESATANAYDWQFDGGNLVPVEVTGSRFTTLSQAYEFPGAKDHASVAWESHGSDQPASFEFVMDVDGDDGLIFETGGTGDGIQIDVSQGVLRAAVSESTNVVVSHNLTNAQKSDFIHVIVVADSANDVLQLYVDGQLKDSEPWTSGNDWSGGDGAGLGGSSSQSPLGDTGDFIGKIAEFNFYQSALSASQAAGNYEMIDWNQAPAFVSDPMIWADAIKDMAYGSSLSLAAYDWDGDNLTFAKESGPAWLTLSSNGAMSGTPASSDVGINTFTVSVHDGINAPVEATMQITVLSALPPNGGVNGYLEFSAWNNLSGGTIADLVMSPAYAGAPDYTTTLWPAADLKSWSQQYGGRMRGSITPTESGTYRFFVAGNYSAELWVSSDSSRFNKNKVAWNDTSVSHQKWTQMSTQESMPIELVAGQSYYIEALVKNDLTNPDHLSIGWAKVHDQPAPLNPVWQEGNHGLSSNATWTENLASMSVESVGGTVRDYTDSYASREVSLEGDFMFTARLVSMDGEEIDASAGLMARETQDTNSRVALIYKTPHDRVKSARRYDTDEKVKNPYVSSADFGAKWLRLIRTGSTINAYVSSDGEVWSQVGNNNLSGLGDELILSLFASAEGATQSVSATWDNIEIQPLPSIVVDSPQLIAPNLLTSATPDANDADDDNLPDDWEVLMGLDETTAASGMGQYGDPDGDGINNYEEYRMGGHPLQATGVPAALWRDLWGAPKGGVIAPFVRSADFLEGPDFSDLLGGIEYDNTTSTMYGNRVQRVRGSLVAPVTGSYRFWIAGTKDYELWLSSDATKFNKQKIASALQWEGDSLYSLYMHDWDRYDDQRSEVFELVAGQSYFIEVLHRVRDWSGHFSVAWQYTDSATGITSERQVIEPYHLRTFVAGSDDLDDDYLPDTWEDQYLLDKLDNGLTDSREGEYGDYDADGLSNHEEWLLGTNPTSSDTDGDGYDDFREITFFGTDPTVSDLAAATLVANFNLASYSNPVGDWYQNADGSLVSDARRGEITYTVNVTQAGALLLELVGGVEGVSEPLVEMPLIISIDGIRLGEFTLRSIDGQAGMVELLTPWLTVGNHDITIFNDNHIAQRRLRIDSLRLLDPGGVDNDSNNTPDWVDSTLQNGNGLTVMPAESYVSPACIEGKARFLEQFALTADAQSVTVERGIGTAWYANIDLNAPVGANPPQAVALVADFEDGNLTEQPTITWKVTDMLTSDDMVIRKDDSLLIGALFQGQQNVSVTIDINGQTAATISAPTYSHQHTFTTTGEHTVEATYFDGSANVTETITVTVLDAELGADFSVLADNSRVWEIPGVPEEVAVEASPEIGFVELEPSTLGNRQFRVVAGEEHVNRVLARVEEGGAIIDHSDVRIYRTYRTDATGDTRIIQTYPNGDQVAMMSFVLPDGLPPGGYIKIKIYAGGVTFLDGTIETTLSAQDFTNGVAYVKFNLLTGGWGSICHTIEVYDADDNLMGAH